MVVTFIIFLVATIVFFFYLYKLSFKLKYGNFIGSFFKLIFSIAQSINLKLKEVLTVYI